MEATAHQPQSSSARRTALRRSIGIRILAAVVLIAFVCLVGDMRRRHNGTSQMERYATALMTAIGESGVIPLNLEASQWIDDDDKPIIMTTLSRDQVGCLRQGGDPMMIAWTVGLVQVLGVNGRAIVSYRDGHAEPSWVSESEFQSLGESQRAALRACE